MYFQVNGGEINTFTVPGSSVLEVSSVTYLGGLDPTVASGNELVGPMRNGE